jgi:hypothetical protein
LFSIPASWAVYNGFDLHDRQDVVQISITNTLVAHLTQVIRVNDLLAQCAARKIRSLRDVEYIFERRFANRTAVYRPQASQDSEKTGFSATIGSDDKEVVAGLYGERQGAHKDVSVGRNDRHVDKLNVFAFCDGTAITQNGGVLLGVCRRYELLLKAAGLDVIDNIEEGGNTRGVSGEFCDFLVWWTSVSNTLTELMGSHMRLKQILQDSQENMTRPKASEDMRSMRRLVTKPRDDEFKIVSGGLLILTLCSIAHIGRARPWNLEEHWHTAEKQA